MNDLNALGIDIYNKIVAFAPSFISAIVLLIAGIFAIRFIIRMVRKLMIDRKLEPTLSNFLANILFWTLRILLFITVITQLGVGTSSFVAILGAAGLAVGLSLQGSLSNFSGGILIIIFKPFKVDDLIEAQGITGTVKEIQIFVTKIISGNNQTVFIPNGILSNGVITNYSMQGFRRADLQFALAYDVNIKIAKDLIMNVMHKNPKILETPEPTIIVNKLTENAIIISAKPYSLNEDYTMVCSQTLEDCKLVFEQNGIDIQPYARESSGN